ncbi:prepilin-type N-terminal cleavage/methylation domain-containing protein [Turicibacter sanguinis]|uniref:prepilin-type N-terminal cleavage/methylation domain-containing protein n=1 Tax=Turicibacter sanguinis TaxID=154288 RepID=UPI0021D50203|nr:prepilin-type N-terminal cleavage/methylation domain-containing protein [Turicibacter sanguinis]MCU7200790.1 prepilin-type N-terminal cleavage/methylation domain-containing protein [Turicibacter sanguinis]
MANSHFYTFIKNINIIISTFINYWFLFFTLIEMMIVLIVVSILTLLIIPNAAKYITKANEDGCVAYKNSLTSQAVAIKLTNGAYPETVDSIDSSATNNLTKICGTTNFSYDKATGEVK